PRSLTSLTASILNSRLNFRLCMTHLWLDKTPNLGVHQTGSSSRCFFSLEAYSATAPTQEPMFQLNAAWVNHTKRAASFWTN
ncbi:hypothetical protein, partial [Bradyrhizobium sp. CW10]|uniref:hypothetical protein n=1 Tax=Bradyrhizobium sp. CW10 TaxID=2782683 RepID=UPI001FFB0B72